MLLVGLDKSHILADFGKNKIKMMKCVVEKLKIP